MAENAASATIWLRAKSGAFMRAMRRVQTTMEKVRERMQAVAASAKRILLVGAAAFAVTTKAAIDQENAEIALDSALKATGHTVDIYGAQLRRTASEIQNLTTVGDEAALAIMSMGLNLGISADQIGEATKMSAGLAHALGQDAKSGMRNYALALKGNFLMLARYIPAVRSARTEQEKLAAVNQMAAAGWQQMQDAAKTTGGRLIQLKNSVGDLFEKIGDVFLPKTKEMAEALQPIIASIDSWIVTNKRWIASTAMTIGRLGVLVAGVYAVGTALTLLAAHPIVAVMIGLAAAFALASKAVDEYIQKAHKLPELTASAIRAGKEEAAANEKAAKALKLKEEAAVTAAREDETRIKRIEDYTANLQLQADTFGMTAREIAAYQVSLEDMSAEERRRIIMLESEITGKEAAVDATKKLERAEQDAARAAEVTADRHKTLQARLGSLVDRLAVARGQMAQSALDMKRLISEGFTEDDAKKMVALQTQLAAATKKERVEREQMARIESAKGIYRRIQTALLGDERGARTRGQGSTASQSASSSTGVTTNSPQHKSATVLTLIYELMKEIKAELPLVGALA